MDESLIQTIDEIVTEIDMSTEFHPWLIIEGNTDSNFFVTRELPNNPKLVVAIGWESVIGVIEKVIEENISERVFGFVDRDYREYLGIEINHEKIVISDFRDVEISFFESEALHKILVELGSENKLPKNHIGQINLKLIRDKIYNTSSIIGKIRFFSLKNKFSFSFNGLDFSKFINPRTLDIDLNKFLSQINSKSTDTMNVSQLNDAISMQLPDKLMDFKYLSSGHDIVEILGIALKKLWGSNNSGDVSRKQLERHFRIGYSNDEFFKTEMYKQLGILLNRDA
ncbi:DUF4435 domain-containing protein [Marichromatium purpuratum]|uniref:DUF4435 domain-containing protein n=1 Tax=Marichromatium purpuratum TaxID=37487 RepID=UPI00021E6955|nr:DUF4435 domain-containing protein [Marichromatium purpuratum]